MCTYKKAVTFSFDDGVESDKRLAELFNKYGLKCSFNLNSGKINGDDVWDCNGFVVKRPDPFDKSIYEGHEICAHGRLHLKPDELDEKELCEEFDEDVRALKNLFNTEICGAAYAFGVYSDKVVSHLKNIGIRFSRTVNSTYNFDIQTDLLRFDPTCSFADPKTLELAEQFLNNESETPQIFYIWGHSYEIDGYNMWDYMENLCKMLSGRDDILYATNSEVFRYFGLID